MFQTAKFADYRSPAWESWRETERDGKGRVQYCGGCGFAHRINNHAPKREASAVLSRTREGERITERV